MQTAPLETTTLPSSSEVETSFDIANDIDAVAKLDAVPTILSVICTMTGLGFAAIARVTEMSWTACAVHDTINLGLKPGSQLDVNSTLCIESLRARLPIVIDHASADTRYCNSPKVRNLESYISVPIILANGRYFGNLYAVDPKPHQVTLPHVLTVIQQFADLIALQIANELRRATEHQLFVDERATGELREQFIAILGHDLRNPLQAVLAGSDLLERKLTEPRHRETAVKIKTSARRMTALIEDILDFARTRLGQGLDVKLRETDELEAGLLTVIDELRAGQPDRQILSNISVTRSVRCDVARVQQLTSNLIANALTHGAPQSPIKVSVSTDDQAFTVQIWNDGNPIPSEHVPKIFQPFWRQTTSHDRAGLGLGLHICSQIAQAHGGDLSVTSTPEAGTEFSFSLPLNRTH